MLEARRPISRCLRLCQPHLDTHDASCAKGRLGMKTFLGVGYAMARGHQVELARPNGLFCPQGVGMKN